MKIDFNKSNGLVPVIIQNSETLQVLMLGYMNEEAYQKTTEEKRVTFFSRSKNRLWTKGETSGNFLNVTDIRLDCDQDTLLVRVKPTGPTCHTGNVSCFGGKNDKGFIYGLEGTIEDRIISGGENSYTKALFDKGVNKVAQKVGEEAVELVIEAMDDNLDLFKGEAADLMYHFLILLKTKNLELAEIEEVLRRRHKPLEKNQEVN